MLKQYKKPALTLQQQLDRLKSRGMHINDEKQVLNYLSNVNYYRLSAYWYPFRLRASATNDVTHQFESNTHFEQVVQLYEFDRHLRLLVMDAIERIEVAVRTKIAYHLGRTYGTFSYSDPANFHPNFKHAKWLLKLEDEIKQSKDVFIIHYKNNYTGFPNIPVWMVIEVISMGGLSVLYAGLRNNEKQGVLDKKVIADEFNLHPKRLVDWLHTLTYVRNICAHHSRLWNRELAIRPDQNKEAYWLAPITPRNDRIFYVLLILRHMLRSNGKGDYWAQQVEELIEPIANVCRWRVAMGMPEMWKEHPLWK